jgi:hypothetical protein
MVLMVVIFLELVSGGHSLSKNATDLLWFSITPRRKNALDDKDRHADLILPWRAQVRVQTHDNPYAEPVRTGLIMIFIVPHICGAS